MLSLDIGII